MSQNYDEKNAQLNALIRPLATARYEVDYGWVDIGKYLPKLGADLGGFEMCPDFQRGHVWSLDQKRHFIENIFRGVVASSGVLLQFNSPNWEMDNTPGDLPNGLQCIDGLQRYTAIQDFLAGDVKPFGLHVDEFNNSRFSVRRGIFKFRVAIHNFKFRKDLLEHYLALNAGGTQHTPEELERVRLLLEKARGNHETS